MFSGIWNRPPNEYETDLWLFDGGKDGDCYDEEDIISWQSRRFDKNFYNDEFINNAASRKLIDEIVNISEPYIDLACGPGMGMIPSLKRICSEIPCLATDANVQLIKEWRKWLSGKELQKGIAFAQFSIFDIPIEDSSVMAYGGFLSISSTRNGNKGYERALSEIFRTLAPKGRLYLIESEYMDIPTILKVFANSGIRPWDCFIEEQSTWYERFIKHGFKILSEETYLNRRLTRNDNELGSAAEKLGVNVEMKYDAFILEKP